MTRNEEVKHMVRMTPFASRKPFLDEVIHFYLTTAELALYLKQQHTLQRMYSYALTCAEQYFVYPEQTLPEAIRVRLDSIQPYVIFA
jgi:hypothetical protein